MFPHVRPLSREEIIFLRLLQMKIYFWNVTEASLSYNEPYVCQR